MISAYAKTSNGLRTSSFRQSNFHPTSGHHDEPNQHNHHQHQQITKNSLTSPKNNNYL